MAFAILHGVRDAKDFSFGTHQGIRGDVLHLKSILGFMRPVPRPGPDEAGVLQAWNPGHVKTKDVFILKDHPVRLVPHLTPRRDTNGTYDVFLGSNPICLMKERPGVDGRIHLHGIVENDFHGEDGTRVLRGVELKAIRSYEGSAERRDKVEYTLWLEWAHMDRLRRITESFPIKPFPRLDEPFEP